MDTTDDAWPTTTPTAETWLFTSAITLRVFGALAVNSHFYSLLFALFRFPGQQPRDGLSHWIPPSVRIERRAREKDGGIRGGQGMIRRWVRVRRVEGWLGLRGPRGGGDGEGVGIWVRGFRG